MKKALVTGITGQDGSYLADLLLEKDYEIHGLVRRSSSINRERLEHIFQGPKANQVHLHYSDLSDGSSLQELLKKVQPDEIYHLGAQSHVRVSFDIPEYTGDVTGLGTLRLLEALRTSGCSAKFYQASSSEMYGKVQAVPQNENTPFYPRSPYAAAKVYAYWITVNYRESYDLFASNGILFNHESPRRGESFVTRKITLALAKIIAGQMEKLSLGNLDSKRDWGYAPDYVNAMWKILQHDKADDFVIATAETHSVKDFVNAAAQAAGLNIVWEGSGLEEHAVNVATGKTIIDIDPRFFRPTEVDLLIGDAFKAKEQLSWTPSVTFNELVRIMMEADLKLIREK